MTIGDRPFPDAADDALDASGTPCPECSSAFVRAHPRQIFCSRACWRTFHGRVDRRGAMLLPFAMASYLTRGGSRGDTATGRQARQDGEFLIRRWKDEDAEAGRMGAVEYMALRYRLGFDRP